MQEHLAGIDRLLQEHEQISAKIGGCNEAINELAKVRQDWIPGRPGNIDLELARLEKLLEEISKDLEEHMRMEEQEFLPVLTKNAVDIVRRGMLYEHQAVLESVSDLREHVRDFVGMPADREEMLEKEARVKGWINRVLELLQKHTQTQGVILDLAREAAAQ
jgi:iron-sulfur cluster repair protein YtfE (RIC family)